jgi:hypothetical protein
MLAFALLLSSCLKLSSPIPATLGDDKTIVFPPFFDSPAQAVGAEGSINELDGELLRAVMVAANDLLPPSDSPRACPNRQEAHLFRVIRKEGIIFVYVYQNPAYCGPEALMLDSGAKYAISTDGRILRRVLDGQPEESPRMETFEDGGLGVPSRPGVTPAYDAVWNKPGDGGSADAGS